MKRLLTYISVFALLFTLAPTPKANAANGSEWKAGNIINDNIFTHADGMSVAEIQNFLNGLVPNCDTWGTQPASEYGRSDITHAQYAASKGWPGPPYVCLKNYHEVPKTAPGPGVPANSYGNGGNPPAGSISAAQMIYNAAKQYNINPKVLLVTIQKESAGPLTKDNWPLQKQYTYAMGAHCPDSGPGGSANCDANYAGFSIQIAESAALMRWYLDSMTQSWWKYKKPYATNNILWNVAPSNCGGSNVYIETKATAALYTYTPYQPNQAALNNLYGTGDGCSAYGNRNFWRIYTDWFGRPTTIPINGCYEATGTSLACVWKAVNNQNGAETLTTSYSEINDLVNRLGYSYYGVEFFARSSAAPKPGNIPVYGLGDPKGKTFVTTNYTEYQALKSANWPDQGVLFYADPAGSNSGYNVYRLYNSTLGQHVWLTTLSDIELYKSNGYVNEGLAFTSLSPIRQEVAPPSGKQLVYRFYNSSSKSHFWTIDVNERDILISKGYAYEGVSWYGSKSTNDKAVYRLYAPSLMRHLYTTDAYEKQVLTASGGWIDEGIAYNVSNTPTSTPVYRLYSPKLGIHLLTKDAYERYILLGSGNWKDEGTAWYQP